MYVEIQVLKKQGFSLRKIAAEVGYAVNTVRAHLARGEAPKYERKVKRQTKLGPRCCCVRSQRAATKSA